MNIFIIPTNTCFGISCPTIEKKTYEKIYKIKKRKLSKPLAILCNGIEYLEKNTKLTKNQIDFLKKYKNPWTILIDKNKILDKKLLGQIKTLTNFKIYKKIAFRISHNKIQKKLTNKYGLLFLTSANKSGEKEIFCSSDIKKSFSYDLRIYNIQIFADNNFCIKSKQNSSDIFEFIGKKNEIKFLRKN